jgi:hypothetical protein
MSKKWFQSVFVPALIEYASEIKSHGDPYEAFKELLDTNLNDNQDPHAVTHIKHELLKIITDHDDETDETHVIMKKCFDIFHYKSEGRDPELMAIKYGIDNTEITIEYLSDEDDNGTGND